MAHVGALCRTLAQRSARGCSQPAQGYLGTLASHSRMPTDRPLQQVLLGIVHLVLEAEAPSGMEAGSRMGGGGGAHTVQAGE